MSNPLAYSENLLSLSPFIDDKGIIRFGERLSNSNLDYAHKYPALIPGNHKFATLIIDKHKIVLMVRHQRTMNAIRNSGLYIHKSYKRLRPPEISSNHALKSCI